MITRPPSAVFSCFLVAPLRYPVALRDPVLMFPSKVFVTHTIQ